MTESDENMPLPSSTDEFTRRLEAAMRAQESSGGDAAAAAAAFGPPSAKLALSSEDAPIPTSHRSTASSHAADTTDGQSNDQSASSNADATASSNPNSASSKQPSTVGSFRARQVAAKKAKADADAAQASTPASDSQAPSSPGSPRAPVVPALSSFAAPQPRSQLVNSSSAAAASARISRTNSQIQSQVGSQTASTVGSRTSTPRDPTASSDGTVAFVIEPSGSAGSATPRSALRSSHKAGKARVAAATAAVPSSTASLATVSSTDAAPKASSSIAEMRKAAMAKKAVDAATQGSSDPVTVAEPKSKAKLFPSASEQALDASAETDVAMSIPPSGKSKLARSPPSNNNTKAEAKSDAASLPRTSVEKKPIAAKSILKSSPPSTAASMPDAAASSEDVPPLASSTNDFAAKFEAMMAAQGGDGPAATDVFGSALATVSASGATTGRPAPVAFGDEAPIGGGSGANQMSEFPDDAFRARAPVARKPVSARAKPAAAAAPPAASAATDDSNEEVKKPKARKPALGGPKKSEASSAAPAAAASSATAASSASSVPTFADLKFETFHPEALMELSEAEARLADFIDATLVAQLSEKKWSDVVDACTQFATKASEMNEAVGFDAQHVEAAMVILNRAPTFRNNNFNIAKSVFDAASKVIPLASDKVSKTVLALPVVDLLGKMSDRKLTESAGALLMSLCEASSPKFIVQQVVKLTLAADYKNLKALPAVLDWLARCVTEFGLASFDANWLMTAAKVYLTNTSKDVRDAAIQLDVCIYKQAGAVLKGKLLDGVAPQTAKSLESALDAVPADQLGQSTATRIVKGQSAPAAAVSLDSLIPRTDLSLKVNDAFLKKLSDDDWKLRKEALDEVNAWLLAAVQRIGPKDGGLFDALGKRLVDKNKNLSRDAIALTASLATAMGKSVIAYKDRVMPNLLLCAGDSKKNIQQEAVTTLQAWCAQCGLSCVARYLPKALATAPGRKEVLELLSQRLTASGGKAEKDVDLEELIVPVVQCMQDKLLDVRNTAERVLEQMALQVGYSSIQAGTRNLKKAELLAIDPLLQRLKKLDGMTEGELAAHEDAAATAAPVSKITKSKGGKKTTASGVTSKLATSASVAALAKPGALSARPATAAPSKLRTAGAAAAAAAAGSASVGSKSVDRSGNATPTDTGATIDSDALITRVDPVAKAKRVKKDALRVKGQFREWTKDEVDELSEQFRLYVADALHAQLFHKDFARQCEACEQLQAYAALHSDATLSILDLILKWCSHRLMDANTKLLMSILSLIDTLFAQCQSADYLLSEGETSNILPTLIERVMGHNNEKFRAHCLATIRTMCRLESEARIYAALFAGFDSKNKKVQCECMSECSRMICQYGVAVCEPKRCVVPVALQVGAGDSSVRLAALDALALLWAQFGDHMWTWLGKKEQNAKIPEKQLTLIQERFRRTKVTGVQPSGDSPREPEPSAAAAPNPRLTPNRPQTARMAAGLGAAAPGGKSRLAMAATQLVSSIPPPASSHQQPQSQQQPPATRATPGKSLKSGGALQSAAAASAAAATASQKSPAVAPQPAKRPSFAYNSQSGSALPSCFSLDLSDLPELPVKQTTAPRSTSTATGGIARPKTAAASQHTLAASKSNANLGTQQSSSTAVAARPVTASQRNSIQSGSNSNTASSGGGGGGAGTHTKRASFGLTQSASTSALPRRSIVPPQQSPPQRSKPVAAAAAAPANPVVETTPPRARPTAKQAAAIEFTKSPPGLADAVPHVIFAADTIVPQLRAELTAPDMEQRRQALKQLWGAVVQTQGAIVSQHVDEVVCMMAQQMYSCFLPDDTTTDGSLIVDVRQARYLLHSLTDIFALSAASRATRCKVTTVETILHVYLVQLENNDALKRHPDPLAVALSNMLNVGIMKILFACEITVVFCALFNLIRRAVMLHDATTKQNLSAQAAEQASLIPGDQKLPLTERMSRPGYMALVVRCTIKLQKQLANAQSVNELKLQTLFDCCHHYMNATQSLPAADEFVSLCSRAIQTTLWCVIVVKHESVRELMQQYSVNSPLVVFVEAAIVDPALKDKIGRALQPASKKPSPTASSRNATLGGATKAAPVASPSSATSSVNSSLNSSGMPAPSSVPSATVAPTATSTATLASRDVENVHRNPNQPPMSHSQLQQQQSRETSNDSTAKVGATSLASSSSAPPNSQAELASTRAKVLELMQRTTAPLQPPPSAATTAAASASTSARTQPLASPPQPVAASSALPAVNSMEALKAKMAAIASQQTPPS